MFAVKTYRFAKDNSEDNLQAFKKEVTFLGLLEKVSVTQK